MSKLLNARLLTVPSRIATVFLTVGTFALLLGCGDDSSTETIDPGASLTEDAPALSLAEAKRQQVAQADELPPNPVAEARRALTKIYRKPAMACVRISVQQLRESFGGSADMARRRCRRHARTTKPERIEVSRSRVLKDGRVRLSASVAGIPGTDFTMWFTGGHWIIQSVH